jgi:hypothetical protein
MAESYVGGELWANALEHMGDNIARAMEIYSQRHQEAIRTDNTLTALSHMTNPATRKPYLDDKTLQGLRQGNWQQRAMAEQGYLDAMQMGQQLSVSNAQLARYTVETENLRTGGPGLAWEKTKFGTLSAAQKAEIMAVERERMQGGKPMTQYERRSLEEHIREQGTLSARDRAELGIKQITAQGKVWEQGQKQLDATLKGAGLNRAKIFDSSIHEDVVKSYDNKGNPVYQTITQAPKGSKPTHIRIGYVDAQHPGTVVSREQLKAYQDSAISRTPDPKKVRDALTWIQAHPDDPRADAWRQWVKEQIQSGITTPSEEEPESDTRAADTGAADTSGDTGGAAFSQFGPIY